MGLIYLRERQLTDDTIHRFGLGYANKTAEDLVRYLKGKGFSEELIREAGLCNTDEKHGMYDKFWNRVMFPIEDINHRVIGFGGRVMGDGKPKYLNSPETPIFDKSSLRRGDDEAKITFRSMPIPPFQYYSTLPQYRKAYATDLYVNCHARTAHALVNLAISRFQAARRGIVLNYKRKHALSQLPSGCFFGIIIANQNDEVIA